VTISGVAKGAGMIAPQMKTATMLAFLLTDANIAKPALKKILKDAVDESFNAITIDGCMSTNDTVLAMANGLADNKSIKLGTKQARDFAQVLKEVCLKLARMIVSDAEGATKFITVHVKGAMNALSAKRLAFSISNSLLFKCAIFGQLANWGRIAAAMGSVIPKESLEKMDIALNKTFLLKSGVPCVLKKRLNLSAGAVDVDVDCKSGKGQARVFTSDLSCDYVKINAAN
jgi:glutamate N-acetyltransferase/amino-acid N-acetyltransferase